MTQKESARLYDFFESDAKNWGFNLDLGPAEMDYEAKVLLALDRLTSIDPDLGKLLKEEFSFFKANHLFVKGRLTEIPDTDPDVLPNDKCRFEQAASQRPPRTSGDKYFIISEKIWNLFDSDSKAGLVLHELIYKYALKLGHTSSSSARFLTAFVASSSSYHGLSKANYLKMLQGLNLTSNASQGLEFIPGSIKYYETGAIKEGILARPQDYKLRQSDEKPARIQRRVYFHANGQVSRVDIAAPVKLVMNGFSTIWNPGIYGFYDNGLVGGFSAVRFCFMST